MKLCLSGLPKLEKAFYLTNRLKPTSRPSLAIPLDYFYLLPKAIYYDNVIPLSEVDDSIDRGVVLREFKIKRLNLEVLETVDYRHEGIAKTLRGYFTFEQPKAENGHIAVGIVSGLENTSLLSTFSAECERYVLDLRDFSFRSDFLKSVFSVLGKIGEELYVVVDSSVQDFMASSEEILVGPKADVSLLSRLIKDVYKLKPDVKLIKRNNRLEVGSSDIKWVEEGEFSPEWVEPSEVDYLKFIIGESEEAKKIIKCIVDVLKTLFETGSVNERDWFTQFTDKGLEMDHARLVSYFLERYGVVTPLLSPAGRNYVLSERGKRIVLKHQRRGEEKEG